MAEENVAETDDAQLDLPDKPSNQQEFGDMYNWLQPVPALAYASICSMPHQPELQNHKACAYWVQPSGVTMGSN